MRMPEIQLIEEEMLKVLRLEGLASDQSAQCGMADMNAVQGMPASGWAEVMDGWNLAVGGPLSWGHPSDPLAELQPSVLTFIRDLMRLDNTSRQRRTFTCHQSATQSGLITSCAWSRHNPASNAPPHAFVTLPPHLSSKFLTTVVRLPTQTCASELRANESVYDSETNPMLILDDTSTFAGFRPWDRTFSVSRCS